MYIVFSFLILLIGISIGYLTKILSVRKELNDILDMYYSSIEDYERIQEHNEKRIKLYKDAYEETSKKYLDLIDEIKKKIKYE